jgi:antitoxin component YwqK of YwqJK toxin-antitoxin module
MRISLIIIFFLSLTIQVSAKLNAKFIAKYFSDVKTTPDVYHGKNNLLYEKGSNIPFTGTVVTFVNNVKWLEYNIKNGKPDGLWTEWNYCGLRKMHSIMYKDDIKIWQRSWTPSGKEFFGEFKNDLPWNGVFEEEFAWGAYFDDTTGNGRGSKYTSFADGIENGPALWYGEKKDEILLAEGIYKNGKPWQGSFVIPILDPLTHTVFLWEIKSFQAGVPDGEVYYYAAEEIARTPETRGHRVYKMVKQNHSGIYRNGERWQGMFVQLFRGKKILWEQLFYKEGKVVSKKYTAVYSGLDNQTAIILGWLTADGEKFPDNESDNKYTK